MVRGEGGIYHDITTMRAYRGADETSPFKLEEGPSRR